MVSARKPHFSHGFIVVETTVSYWAMNYPPLGHTTRGLTSVDVLWCVPKLRPQLIQNWSISEQGFAGSQGRTLTSAPRSDIAWLCIGLCMATCAMLFLQPIFDRLLIDKDRNLRDNTGQESLADVGHGQRNWLWWPEFSDSSSASVKSSVSYSFINSLLPNESANFGWCMKLRFASLMCQNHLRPS